MADTPALPTETIFHPNVVFESVKIPQWMCAQDLSNSNAYEVNNV